MKTSLLNGFYRSLFTIALLVAASAGYAQTIPELIFRNPVLESGVAGQDGAKYRFSNVATGNKPLDAIVEIRGRSANDVVLRSIDSSGVGWDKAFQPSLGIPNVGANREWWMEFRVEFVESGKNNNQKIDKFYITGLDIDGDNGNLNEWVEMDKPKDVFLSPVTNLTATLLGTILDLLDLDNNGSDFRIDGPRQNYTNIDTSATAAMATYYYEKKSKITFKLGGKTNANGGSPGDVPIRMNSLWFKQFSLNPPQATLPVQLVNFSAMLVDQKVNLKWTTATEKNVSHFVVERSLDGKNFTEAGMVFAYGNTTEKVNYSFPDNSVNLAQAGVVYYRLRTIDIDKKSQLSDVKLVRLGKKNEQAIGILTYPNPVTNELRVTIPSTWQGAKVSFEVLTNSGQVVIRNEAANSGQTENLNVSRLTTGYYLVRATCNGETAQQKIIKQ